MKLRICFWFFLVVLTSSFAPFLRAQDPLSQRLTFANGLPSNAVYSILEDRKGFIWIACDEGLFQYDGVRFQQYREHDQTSFSGSNLLEDKLGRIWYQNFDGKIFYVENGQIFHLKQQEKKQYYPVRLTDTHLFYLDENELVVLNLVNLQEVKRISVVNPVSSIVLKNKYYYVDENKLNCIDGQLNSKFLEKLFVQVESMPVLFTSESHVYFVFLNHAENGVWKLENSKISKKIALNEQYVIQSAKIFNQKIYLQTTQGIHVFSLADPTKKSVYFQQHNFSDALVDRKQNHWFISPIEGIIVVPDLKVRQITLPNTLPYRSVKGKKSLLISTKDDKVLRYDGKSGETEILHQGNKNAEIYYLFFDSLVSQLIFVSSDGNTHFCSMNTKNLEQKIRFAIKQILRLDAKYRIYTSTGSLGFFVDKKQQHLQSKWDKYIQKLTHSEIGDFDFYHLQLTKFSPRGKAILYDQESETVFFATNVGLFTWKNGVFSELKNGKDIYDIKSMFKWGKYIFGFGSNGKLQLISNVSSEIRKQYVSVFEIDEIKRAKVYGKHLMVLTKQKMFHFVSDRSEKPYLKSEFELTNLECNDFAMLDGVVWIVSTNGLIQWNLFEKNKAKVVGHFVFKSIQMNGKEVPLKNNIFTYQENNLSIDFALLDFGNKTIEDIYYKVNRSKWQQIDPSVRSLNFPELSPGSYTIQFKGLVAGKWKYFESIQFNIKPPFWTSVWFIVSLMAILLLLSYVYYTIQLRSYKVRNELINEKIQLESDLNNSLLASIKSQMNPHFIFNALNTIQAYIYMNERDKATGYLSKFSKLTRAILQMSEKDKIRLSQELEALTLYLELEKMRFHEGFEYQIEIKDVNVEAIEIPSMLIQPFIENAIKHGLLHRTEEKRLRISISQNEGNLFVEIDDNGIGRKRAEELKKQRDRYHEGFSSRANEKRLKLLSRNTILSIKYIDKVNEFNQATGTTVQLIIELKA